MEDLSSMFAPIRIFDKRTGEGCDIEGDWKFYNENIQPILAKYNWFVSPNINFGLKHYLFKNLGQQADTESFLNKVFVYFFSANNFDNLEFMIESWYCYSKVGDRFPILEECVNILKDSIRKNSNIKNPHCVIIPTLISQIDGLKGSIIEQQKQKNKNNNIKDRNIIYGLIEKKYVSDSINTKYSFIYNWLFTESTTANDLLFDILFQTAHPMDKIEDLKPPFSRHKIMHGQYLEYGNIENTIRLFLLIDFLAELNYLINSKQEDQ